MGSGGNGYELIRTACMWLYESLKSPSVVGNVGFVRDESRGRVCYLVSTSGRGVWTCEYSGAVRSAIVRTYVRIAC